MVKNLPAMQEIHIRSLDQDDPLRKEWQPSIPAWKIQWTEELDGLQSIGLQRVQCNTLRNQSLCPNQVPKVLNKLFLN